ncbi:hypothetical protein SAMN02927900_05298 [Rhizobium mongolense subsp. loessense]|uniref:Uncharacterized protein n=1 Tax=Rhizobium mongolense subsp. loessense TaxID=158890 RepID=A0A1G4TLL7_9HYPH|nr:hypothetical protein SAMN02927900_05298 [Rhizobium mongolense subsp. loessense]
MVCLEGLHNRVPLENVRAAFIKAAHEAIDAARQKEGIFARARIHHRSRKISGIQVVKSRYSS